MFTITSTIGTNNTFFRKKIGQNKFQRNIKQIVFLLVVFVILCFSVSCVSTPADSGAETEEAQKAQRARDAAADARSAANKGFLDEFDEGVGLAEISESMPGTRPQPEIQQEPELQLTPSPRDEPEILVAKATTNTGKSQPAWVKNPQSVFPSSRYLSAVGSGKSTSEAENAAVASIARIIKQDVSSSLITTEKDSVSSTGTSMNKSTVDEIVETYAVVDALVGVKVGEFWWDKNQTVYAVAYVDKQEASLYYTKKINDNETLIMDKIDTANKNKGQFPAFTAALQALSLAEENDQYLDILHAMDARAARAKVFRYGSLASVKEVSYQIAQTIAIDIAIVGDDDGRVGLALSKMLAKHGFQTHIGRSGATYLLDSAVSFVDVPSQRNVYVRYIFSANLTEKSTAKILLPYTDNKREGHTYAEGARERALQSLLDSIQTRYADFFVEFLKR